MNRIQREIRAVYADYGHDLFNEDLIQEDWWPKHGPIYLIESPIHLFNVALGLAAIGQLEPLDIIGKPWAIGFKTELTTVVTKLDVLRRFFTRYDGTINQIRLEQANLLARLDFRRRYCDNPIQMRRQYPFLAEN